jgi:hypothetical protein
MRDLAKLAKSLSRNDERDQVLRTEVTDAPQSHGIARGGRLELADEGKAGPKVRRQTARASIKSWASGEGLRKIEEVVPRGGIEPPTRGFSVPCSTI